MNCHRNIAEYNGEEDLENGYTKIFILKLKLYAAVGWDETNQRYTGEHNRLSGLNSQPSDFVYFNHAQHVEVGKSPAKLMDQLKKWRLCVSSP